MAKAHEICTDAGENKRHGEHFQLWPRSVSTRSTQHLPFVRKRWDSIRGGGFSNQFSGGSAKSRKRPTAWVRTMLADESGSLCASHESLAVWMLDQPAAAKD